VPKALWDAFTELLPPAYRASTRSLFAGFDSDPRRRPMRSQTTNSTPADFTLRFAHGGDSEALIHLAQLDSQREPTGALLVAESGAGIVAALPLAGGSPVANPFVRTAEAVDLLRLRRAQLAGGKGRHRRGIHARATGRLRPATA
jgi:hypothetical protein